MTRTFNTRLVIKTIGALLLIEASFMLLPTIVCLIYKEKELNTFCFSTAVTMVAGIVGLIVGRKAEKHVGAREGYLIVAIVWFIFSLFGMLPYYLSGAIPNFTDAFFETMSGFTTTGATVIPNVEVMGHGILFWRSLTQWLGGMGIIVLSIAILPMFGMGGMQLYAAEMTGLSYEKVSPRISDTAKLIWTLYLCLTLCEILLLWLFGMDLFDSVCHSLSTMATGGFSTKNNSLAYYDNAAIHYTVSVFMLLAGVNFVLLIYLLRGKPKHLFRDEETRWYAGCALVCALVVFIGLYITRPTWAWEVAERSFRDGLFTVVAAMTSTGYSISNYVMWPSVLWVLVLFLMLTGGCAGSTSGGIKWVRLVIIIKNGLAEFKRRIHPNAIIPVKINGKPVGEQSINNTMAFMLFYMFIIGLATLIFCACGLGFDESIGTAISAMGNVGISIGQFGPAGTYAAFPLVGKWVMVLIMLIGRLEIFTVLLLFSPTLWKK